MSNSRFRLTFGDVRHVDVLVTKVVLGMLQDFIARCGGQILCIMYCYWLNYLLARSKNYFVLQFNVLVMVHHNLVFLVKQFWIFNQAALVE